MGQPLQGMWVTETTLAGGFRCHLTVEESQEWRAVAEATPEWRALCDAATECGIIHNNALAGYKTDDDVQRSAARQHQMANDAMYQVAKRWYAEVVAPRRLAALKRDEEAA